MEWTDITECLFIDKIAGWFFGILITAGFFYTKVPIGKHFASQQLKKRQDQWRIIIQARPSNKHSSYNIIQKPS